MEPDRGGGGGGFWKTIFLKGIPVRFHVICWEGKVGLDPINSPQDMLNMLGNTLDSKLVAEMREAKTGGEYAMSPGRAIWTRRDSSKKPVATACSVGFPMFPWDFPHVCISVPNVARGVPDVSIWATYISICGSCMSMRCFGLPLFFFS